MKISLGNINSKLKAYCKSDEGKRKMKEYIETCSKRGQGKTSGGSTIMTTNIMKTLAVEFVEMLKQAAIASGLPPSVLERHIDTITCSSPQKMPDGSHTITVSFGGNLHRDSLYEEKYPEGIDNIVALFNNGLNNDGYVYGWWDNHSPTGEALGRSLPGDTFAWIRSKKNRSSLQFVQRAISDFENKYKSTYSFQVIPGEHYDESFKWETVKT